MQRLVKDAAKLDKSVNANSLSYANIVKAIHAVQVEMGVYGTTQKEAEKTVTGSLNAMKSAWGNLLTAIGSGENLDQCFENMISTVEIFGNNIIPVLERSLAGMGTVVGKVAPKIAEILPDLANKIIPPLINAAVQVVQEIGNALPNMITTLLPIAIDAILQLISGLLNVLDTSGVQIITAILDGLMQAINGIISILPQFIQVGIRLIVALIVGIVQKLPELIPVLIEGFFLAIGSLVEMIPEIFSGLWNAITSINWIDLGKSIINSIWEGIKSVGTKLGEGIKGLFTGKENQDLSSKGATAGSSYASGLQSSINGISLNSASSKITSDLTVDLTNTGTTTAQTYTTAMDTGLATTTSNVQTFATDITKEFSSINLTDEGAQTVQGLINGMNSKKQVAINTAKAIASAINAEYRKVQDINSPSGEWESYGEYQIQGDVNGMKNKLPLLKSTVQKIGEYSLPYGGSYTPDNSVTTNSRSSVSETNHYSPQFNLTITGTSDDRATARKVKRWVAEAFEDVFTNLENKNPKLREV